MAFSRLLVVGALGVVAWKTWQRHQARARDAAGTHDADDGAQTPPHGDPVLVGKTMDVAPAPAAGAQSSPGFGAP